MKRTEPFLGLRMVKLEEVYGRTRAGTLSHP